MASTETSPWIAALYSVSDSTQYYPAFSKTASVSVSPVHWEEKPGRGWRREKYFLFNFAGPESVLFRPQTCTSAAISLVRSHNKIRYISGQRCLPQGAAGWCQPIISDEADWKREWYRKFMLQKDGCDSSLWPGSSPWAVITQKQVPVRISHRRKGSLALWRRGTIPENSKTWKPQLEPARFTIS